MFGNLLFGLTLLTYIALSVFNIQKLNVPGERLVGASMIAFGLIAAYIVFSLFLTIAIASRGGFNWISTSASSRNIVIGILWFGMVAGVVFCSMLTTEYQNDQTTGIWRLISLPVYFGGLWLPLLMLIPYAILLNSGWRESLSPMIYKIPLWVGCITGILIMMTPKIVTTFGITIPRKQIDNNQVEADIKSTIDSQSSISDLLEYTQYEDDRYRIAAWAKIKSDPNWESELIKLLEHDDEYGHHYFRFVYIFLDKNKVDHPDRFIAPINTSIGTITAEVQRVLEKSFLYSPDLSVLNIDIMCRVLDDQFK
ncbi:MAG: hypothetical protein KBA14_06585, partial [Saprospiraceae bacterium]|nr:hypothetical protein [Saprospiraceae bacterium]